MIVVSHLGGGVKEQIAGAYAKKLAAHGFVTIAYDANAQHSLMDTRLLDECDVGRKPVVTSWPSMLEMRARSGSLRLHRGVRSGSYLFGVAR